MRMLLYWDGYNVAMEIWSDMQIVDNQAVPHLRVVIFADHKSTRTLIIRHLHNTPQRLIPPAINAPPISDHLFFQNIYTKILHFNKTFIPLQSQIQKGKPN